MRLLVYSTLFPNAGMPQHGIFVQERLAAWRRRHGGQALVIAPVPWIPRSLARGPYAAYRDVPAQEERDGVRVLHPRYPLVPRVSMSLAPLFLSAATRNLAMRVVRQHGPFDLLDAHYLYPDAVAAALLSRGLGLPLVVTARGTDVNLIPRHRAPRAWLRWMLRRADAAVCVADALRRAVEPLAPPGLPVRVLRNGVDLEKFRPQSRDGARRARGWEGDGPLILSVGHLIERKGHHRLIAALPHLPEVRVKIVGSGPWRERLQRLAGHLGVQDRVELVGPLPHDELASAYAAADLLVLLSSREGWPNVLLEALACGTPVLATRTWGTPEVVRDPAVGTLLDDPAPEAVARAVRERLAGGRDGEAIRHYAEQHSWVPVADAMEELFRRIAAGGAARETP